MSSEAIGRGAFDIGRALGETLGAIRRNAGVLAAPALVFAALPTFALGAAAALSASPDTAADIQQLGNIPVSLLSIALQASIFACLAEEARGRKPKTGAVLAAGGRLLLPLFLLNIIVAIGVLAGLLFLIVPGIFIGCAWAVAAPALVAEKRGVFDALSRSWALTRDNRWRIFLVLLIVWVIALIPIIVLGAALGFMGEVGDVPTIPGAIVEAIATVILVVGPTAASSVIHAELVAVREGVSAQPLAEIFS